MKFFLKFGLYAYLSYSAFSPCVLTVLGFNFIFP